MKVLKLFLLLLLSTASINAQSFYVLTGVKSYNPIVANTHSTCTYANFSNSIA